MKKIVGILIVALLFVGCKQKITQSDIVKINGYWEIEKVILEDGEEKLYGVNESFDFFELNQKNTGIRKKVMPQLDGTFLVNDTYENVKVRFTENQTFLDYNTPYMKWSEEILTVTDSTLVVLNAAKKEYHYKKTGPVNLDKNGKKIK